MVVIGVGYDVITAVTVIDVVIRVVVDIICCMRTVAVEVVAILSLMWLLFDE